MLQGTAYTGQNEGSWCSFRNLLDEVVKLTGLQDQVVTSDFIGLVWSCCPDLTLAQCMLATSYQGYLAKVTNALAVLGSSKQFHP